MAAVVLVASLPFIAIILAKLIRSTEPAIIIPGMVYICKYKKDFEVIVLEVSPYDNVWYIENNKRGRSYSLEKKHFIKFFTIKGLTMAQKENR